MATLSTGQRTSVWLMALALIPTIGLVAVPNRYSAPVAVLITAAQLAFIGGAAAMLVRPAWRSGSEARRQIVVVGLLFLVPWTLLTLMPGYGPPFAATLAMNHVRYVILFVSTAFLGAAFLLLRDPLAQGGERLLAPLGQAAGLLAGLIQLVWCAIMIGWTMTEAHRPKTYLPMDGTPLANSADVLLFFAGLFTYVAMGLYALSMARAGWLGRGKVGAMTAISLVAIIVLIMRGLQFPDFSETWYTVPGMVVGIPAIPWLMPYLLGVALLARAAAD